MTSYTILVEFTVREGTLPRFVELVRTNAAASLAGEPGRYVSLPYRIMSVPMTEAFEVLLADGVSRLRGSAGDWRWRSRYPL